MRDVSHVCDTLPGTPERERVLEDALRKVRDKEFARKFAALARDGLDYLCVGSEVLGCVGQSPGLLQEHGLARDRGAARRQFDEESLTSWKARQQFAVIPRQSLAESCVPELAPGGVEHGKVNRAGLPHGEADRQGRAAREGRDLERELGDSRHVPRVLLRAEVGEQRLGEEEVVVDVAAVGPDRTGIRRVGDDDVILAEECHLGSEHGVGQAHARADCGAVVFGVGVTDRPPTGG